MPIYEMRCPKCGETETIYCHHSMLHAFRCQKEGCDEKLVQIPSEVAFKIEGARSHKGSRKNYE